ncbi:SpoIIE family protein phosphatase [Deltaproteobacteria bacterium TL4]
MSDLVRFDHIFPYVLPPLLTILFCLLLIAFTLFAGKDNQENRTFALICILQLIYSGTALLGMVLVSPTLWLHFVRIGHLVFIFSLPVAVQFTHQVIGVKNRKGLEWFLYVVIIAFIPVTHTENYIQEWQEFSFGFYIKGGWALSLIGALGLVITLYCVYCLKQTWKQSPPAYKHKFAFILGGVILGWLLHLANILPASGVDFYPIAHFGFLPLGIISYGLWKYELLDLRNTLMQQDVWRKFFSLETLKSSVYLRKRFESNVFTFLLISGYISLLFICMWALDGYPGEKILTRIVPYGIPPLLILLGCLFLSLLALRGQQQQREPQIFSLICLIYSFYSCAVFLNSIVQEAAVALKLVRWYHFFLPFQLALGWHLAYLFAGKKNRWILVYLAYLFCAAIAPLTQSEFYIVDVVSHQWGFFGRTGDLYNIIFFLAIIWGCYPFWLFFKAHRQNENPLIQRRIRYLALGFGSASFLLFLNMTAVNDLDLYPPGNFAFIPIFYMAYGIFKDNHQEMTQLIRKLLYGAGLLFMIWGMALVLHLELFRATTIVGYFKELLLILSIFYGANAAWKLLLELYFGQSGSRILNKILGKIMDELSHSRHFLEIYQVITSHLFETLLASRCDMIFYDDRGQKFSGWQGDNRRYGFFSAQAYIPQRKEVSIFINANHPVLQLFKPQHENISRVRIEEWIVEEKLEPDSDDFLRMAEWIHPIFSKDKLTCLLLIGDKIDGSSYSKREEYFMHQLGLLLSPHIDNAALLQKLEFEVHDRTQHLNNALEELKKKDMMLQDELEIASKIQKGILPTPPLTYKGIQIDTYYQAMGKVSGDFYDFLPMEDGSVYVLIADAMGHGVPAAFITIIAKMEFNEIVRQQSSPKTIIRQMNRIIGTLVKTHEYLTAFLLKIDPDFQVVYSNASHPQAIVLRKSSRTFEYWDTNGLFIGALVDEQVGYIYEEKRNKLHTGDRVFMYTDGLIEARNSQTKDYWGEERLEKFLQTTFDLSLNEIKPLLIESLTHFTGATLSEDDVTFIILEIP